MRRYRMPTGRVRPCQPNTRLERNFLTQGAQLVEDDDPALLNDVDQAVVDELAGLDREERWRLADWARAAQAVEGLEVVHADGQQADKFDPLAHDNVTDIIPLVEDLDYAALEQLIRNETDGRNRRQVLAGLERLRKNAPGNPAGETKKGEAPTSQ